MSTDIVREGTGTARDIDSAPKSWKSYWEVPALCDQKPEHRAQSQYYVRQLESAVALDPKMRVLDFGCGFGFVAEALAQKVAEVWLWDASLNMKSQAQRLNASRKNVRLIDLTNEQSDAPLVTFDLILVNSVVQYMTMEELSGWLTRWHTLMAPNGRVILSDLIPPHSPSLFFELYESFMFNAKSGLLLHLLSPTNVAALKRYSKTSQATGPLLQVDGETLRRLGTGAGLSVEILPNNLTYFTKRLGAVLTKLP